MNRYEKLYYYLLANSNRWVSQKEICEKIEGYRYTERKNDKAPSIRQDMLIINSTPEFSKIVICNKYQFKIATLEEYKDYRNERIRRLKAQVKMLKDIDYKHGIDGTYNLLLDTFNEVYGEGEQNEL